METAAHHAGMNARQLGLITDHLQRNYIDTGKIAGCQTVVARHGHVAYHSSLGMMDLERARPMADDAIFRIYSMTKPITSIALMQLYERGLFQLNDPVYRVIPSWRAQKVYVSGEGDAMQLAPPEQPMTFKHVLSHTAGLSYGATAHPADRVYRDQNVVREGCDLATFIERMAGVPLRFTPGTRWMYSYATDVCGHLVEALSGMPLDRYFQEHIFAPLGMTDTAFSTPRENASRLTANYGRGKNKTLRLLDDPQASDRFDKPLFLSGGGGLLGTTADYLRFCEMLRCGGTLSGERIIGSRTLALMHRNHLPGGRDLASLAMGAFSETAYEGVGFGLGFATSLGSVATASPGNRDYYWGGAASTIFWVDPDEDLIVIFMTQLMPSDTFNFRGQLRNIVYAAID
ncbi:MAG: beta-lactamase family protein [Pseudomonadales bacterium]|nr:beta-lactamase family protein [Pseudomonadales bacterium]MCP5183096.1 beta-lactamase family protein [Pseudomonadales bacterium]